MITLIAAVILSTAPVHKECKLVCPVPHKKVVHKKPSVSVLMKPVTEMPVQAQVQEQHQEVTVIVNNPVKVNDVPLVYQPHAHPWVVGGLRGAVGFWDCSPHVFGLVGLRVRFPDAYLGAEINTQFYWGHAAQIMVYPIQRETSGSPINWHINGGLLWHAHYGFAAQDVPRHWDMTVGTGIEWPILPFLALTADVRVAMPNPVTMTKLAWPDSSGRYVNTGNVVANSLMGTQFMVGAMITSW